MLDLELFRREVKRVLPVTVKGRILSVSGPVLKATLSGAAVGDLVEVQTRNGAMNAPANERAGYLLAQIVGFSSEGAILTPFGPIENILPGAEVIVSGKPPRIVLGEKLVGSVVDAFGKPLQADAAPPVRALTGLPTIVSSSYGEPPPALSRRGITEPFITGIRAIDGFATLGRGSRLGVFAEPGGGKSTLLSTIARNCQADVIVIGLIGERGREVNELLVELDQATRAKSVVVVSTSDEAAVKRVLAAHTATRIAEYFRELGCNVLLLLDSLTRLFRAFREVGLAAGEVPVRRGYPPSLFAALPGLLERAGNSAHGSITALYTVLLSSDLDEDPMVEEVKGLTDGHLMLRRELAERQHYPAIDILGSISRVMNRVTDSEMQTAVRKIRSLYSRLTRDRDIAILGGQVDAELELALRLEQDFNDFLRQPQRDASSFAETKSWLLRLASA